MIIRKVYRRREEMVEGKEWKILAKNRKKKLEDELNTLQH